MEKYISYDIEIEGWERYQTRKDLESMSWFRLQTDLFDSNKFYQLKTTSKLLWVYVLTRCARVMSGTCTIHAELAQKSLRTRADVLQRAVNDLEQNQLLKVVSRNAAVRTNKHNKQTQQTQQTQQTGTLKKPKKEPKSFALERSQILTMWEEVCTGHFPMPRRPLSKSRVSKFNQRLRENPKLETWANCFEKLKASDFCNGQNDRNWIADFDFVLKADSISKILEGKYDNREKKGSHAAVMAKVFNEL